MMLETDHHIELTVQNFEGALPNIEWAGSPSGKKAIAPRWSLDVPDPRSVASWLSGFSAPVTLVG
jgi:hypothetical protein